jgi:cytochrome b
VSSTQRIRVWDLPTRIFHWTLAILVVLSYTTGKIGGSGLEWHMKSGYAILALLVFRLAWGIVGSDTARFSHFVRGPRAAFHYARETFAGRHPAVVGHNPLGGWMVVVMLVLLVAQAATGLFVDDEISTQGPLTGKVSNAVVARMTAFHHYNQWVVVAAVVLHILAIAYYYLRLKTNLVSPMLGGWIVVPPGMRPPHLRHGPAWVAAVLFAIAAAAIYWLVMVYPKS